MLIKFDKRTPLKATRQQHGTVPDTNQPADGVANRFKHASHFAVTPFRNRDPIPAVGTLAATGLNRAKRSHAIVQRHAFEQTLFLFVAERAQNPDGVLAFQTKTRVHQPVGQLSRTGQKQQAFGVQIKPADGLPLALKQFGQAPENCRPVLRIVMSHHLASRLVVRNHARRRRIDTHANGFAVDLDAVTKLDALADVSGLGIDRYPAFEDQLLHFKPRTQTGLSQNLVELGRFRQRRQNALGRRQGGIVLIGVKLPGDYIGETRSAWRCPASGARQRRTRICLPDPFFGCY